MTLLESHEKLVTALENLVEWDCDTFCDQVWDEARAVLAAAKEIDL